jgi:hypothetical protein
MSERQRSWIASAAQTAPAALRSLRSLTAILLAVIAAEHFCHHPGPQSPLLRP